MSNLRDKGKKKNRNDECGREEVETWKSNRKGQRDDICGNSLPFLFREVLFHILWWLIAFVMIWLELFLPEVEFGVVDRLFNYTSAGFSETRT